MPRIAKKRVRLPWIQHCTFIICVLATSLAPAQEVMMIDLETVLQLSDANNLTIKQYQQQEKLAYAQLVRTREWWLPELAAGLQTQQLWGAVMNGNGNFFLDVNRDNLWSGLGVNATWDFGEEIFKTKARKLQAEAAQYQSQHQRNMAILQIIDEYYDLVGAQLAYQAYQVLVHYSDTLVQQMEIQVDAGLRPQSEFLLAKSNHYHIRVQMLEAKSVYQVKSARVVKLLNLDPAKQLVSLDTLLLPLQLMDTDEPLNFEINYQQLPEFKKSELELSALVEEKKAVVTGLLIPELRVDGYLSYFGALASPVTAILPGPGDEINQLYPTKAFNLSLMWQIPLGSLTSGGDRKIYDAKIGIQQNQLQQIKAQANEQMLASSIALANNREQMEIADEGSAYAAEALRQSMQRQALGTIKPFEVLRAQEILIKSLLDYLDAVASYNKSQYALFVAKGGDL